MKNFAISCSILGGFVLSFGLLSLFIKERLYIAETAVATLYGILCKRILKGTQGEELMQNLETPSFVFNFAHIVLSLQLVAVGVTVPKAFLKKNWVPIATLLLPVMAIMYLISTVIVKYVLKLDWLPAMIIGSCVTPTDPILASAVLKGKFANKYIPSRYRLILAVESGANDGLGFPLLTLPLLLLRFQSKELTLGEAMKDWIVNTWGFEILLAVVIGTAIGYGARVLLKYSMRRLLIDKESFLVYILALAILVTGLTAMIESDDLLAVFISGLVFSWDEEMVQDMKDSHILEVVDLVFNQAFFIVFGMIIPETVLDPKKIFAAALIILLRRLPGVFLMKMLYLLPGFSRKEAFFTGWFGPIGVGAIFFAHHAQHVLKANVQYHDTAKIISDFVYTVVVMSIMLHGTTAPVIHLHMKSKQKKGKKAIDAYGSDTEAEKDQEILHLQQLM